MRAEVLNSFIAATLEALRTMAGVEPRRGTPRVKGSQDKSYDVSGIVGITGQVQGFVVLSFRRSTALHVVGGFLGETIGTVDEQVIDAVGELANIVAGGAKRVLSEAGYLLTISIPSVVVGTSHVIARPTATPCFEIPFETPQGPFCVELCLKSET
ncbi:MAG: chemotaxis protein CheX [Deltaproteobacteria bacterium]|nr:chemotaxis protein CheX [Deltaproteobacteria bacterium]